MARSTKPAQAPERRAVLVGDHAGQAADRLEGPRPQHALLERRRGGARRPRAGVPGGGTRPPPARRAAASSAVTTVRSVAVSGVGLNGSQGLQGEVHQREAEARCPPGSCPTRTGSSPSSAARSRVAPSTARGRSASRRRKASSRKNGGMAQSRSVIAPSGSANHAQRLEHVERVGQRTATRRRGRPCRRAPATGSTRSSTRAR